MKPRVSRLPTCQSSLVCVVDETVQFRAVPRGRIVAATRHVTEFVRSLMDKYGANEKGDGIREGVILTESESEALAVLGCVPLALFWAGPTLELELEIPRLGKPFDPYEVGTNFLNEAESQGYNFDEILVWQLRLGDHLRGLLPKERPVEERENFTSEQGSSNGGS